MVTHLLVDGMNVIGSRPDGWWRDRDGAVLRLFDRLVRLAATGDDVTVVLDGRPLEQLPDGMHRGVRVAYARRHGRDAADDRIIELLRELPDPAGVHVVTSDRTLARRARDLGATVGGAGELLRRLDTADE